MSKLPNIFFALLISDEIWIRSGWMSQISNIIYAFKFATDQSQLLFLFSNRSEAFLYTYLSILGCLIDLFFVYSLNLFQENFFLHLHASDKAFDKGNIFVRLTWLVFSATNTALDVPLEKQYGISSTTVPIHLTLTFVDLT